MLKALDVNRRSIAYLENAYDVSYEKEANSIWSASFSLPLNDRKVSKVKQLGYVEIVDVDGEYIGLFRVMPELTTVNADRAEVKFELKHVLSTLMDSVMFKYHEIPPNTATRETIEYLLNLQKVKHWKLGRCDFEKYFQYSWENENGLVDALWSVPKPFVDEYMWTYDTTTYPWVLNLIKPDLNVTARVRESHNLKGFKIEKNPNQLVNRVYPLGSGEGVNQLNIKKVNPTGQAYIENAQSIIDNGLIEYIWVDRRFTDAKTLYESAKALLEKFAKAKVSWEIDAVDLLKCVTSPGEKVPKIDELRLGKVIQVRTEKFGIVNLRILKESKSDVFGDPGNIKLSIGNVMNDLGTTQADIERKIEINQLYSQGATNILNYDKADNADEQYPVKFRIYIDDDVVKINTCELTFETTKFRAYSKTLKASGKVVKSTSSGGGSVQSTTSQAAGQSTQTSSANGSHRHRVFIDQTNFVGPQNFKDGIFSAYGYGFFGIKTTGGGDIYTEQAADNHTHTVTTPSHTHNVSITIPNHTHNIDIPEHTHEIQYGIYEDSDVADRVTITVDGNAIPGTDTSKERFNIVEYLSKSNDGTINRGWHEIVMTPNKRARIEAQITMRVFIKSQLGGEF
ncbi:phage tail spike protein [Enterococcus cecorum]|uniref:phage tail spike protein n=1 Tax=Enterococcus cecorum TaxID=44008 RepID=UPI002ACAB277|nr:phage tail spike protein [Enterococcus cecorum]MDZ5589964.1 phage tail spike protein [Enterococcus cecorum]